MPAGTPQTKAPVRMGKLFSHMLVDCPLDIQVYGACVANLSGGVDRFACDKEFSKLRECFQRAAKKKK
ncbi:hypothetical protein Gpo141_00006179 [Globisporangium polare]